MKMLTPAFALLATALLATVTPTFADVPPHMGGWGYGNGPGMFLGAVVWLIFLGLLVVGVVLVVLQLVGAGPKAKANDALRELDLRLARGDLTIEEHAARRKALMG